MASNIYFQNALADQNLLNEINREVIQQAGIDVMYLPRTLVKEDLVMNEDVLSKFSNAYQIEMFVKSNEGFGGEGDLVSKFGLDVRDELILVAHVDSFKFATDMAKPLEGDLIYFPLSERTFEIKFVEHEQPFYQVGQNYVFEITCEVFQYGEEDIDTGTDVDKVERENAYAIDLVLTAVGGSGNFIVDEEIYQGASLAAATAKGIVTSWDSANKTVRVNTVVGTFAAPKKVTGETSGAYYDQASVDDQALPTVPYADNKILETDGDNILDFTELDPWSEGDL